MYQCPICKRWTEPCEISGVLSCQDCYDKRKKTINSTDKQKLVIRKMFAEPIDEVQVATDSLSKAINDLDRAQGVDDFILDRMIILRNKLTNLKSMLPVIQDAP